MLMQIDHEKRETAKSLLYVARQASDFEDFAELAGMLSKFPLEPAQLQGLYDEAWQLFAEQEREEAAAGVALSLADPPRPPDYVPVFTYHLGRIFEIVLVVAGAKGAEVSANLLYPLTPPGFEAAVDQAFRSMRSRLTPVGWEQSLKPSRKGGRTRTYRVL
jgi:hypothetical protein